jgi:anti-anti-sigma factor
MPALEQRWVDGYPDEWHRFEITVEHGSEGVRVRVAGELDIATAPKLHRVLDRLEDDGHQHLLLDLTRVGFIDTRGVEAIVRARRSANSNASGLTIRHRARQVRRLLELTNMLSYLSVDSSTGPGLAS